MIILETDRLRLRDYTEEDFEAYYRLKTDERTMYYLPDIKLGDREEALKEFKEVLADAKSPNRKFYFLHMELKDSQERDSNCDNAGLVDNASSSATIAPAQLGSVGYTVVDNTPVGKIVHLGYFTYEKYWGNGYMTEAVAKVLEFAFTQDNVYRVTTGCLAENKGSERVMIKNGMIKEAEHVDYEWHDGKMKTRHEYRLLRPEWEELHR